jgi:glutathione synthase/RimK-type ligase-like ATP-grasp enzyme
LSLLLISNEADLTADLIVREARTRGVGLIRLNCDNLDAAVPSFAFEGGAPTLSFLVKGRRYQAADISAAYLRRPDLTFLRRHVAGEATYIFSEWRALLQAFYAELRGKWLNEPDAMAAAEDKVSQLRLASSLGLRIPRTLVSNDPDAIRSFVQSTPAIVKPLRSGILSAGSVFTNRFSDLETEQDEAVRQAPLIVQEEVRKAADIRVTVVGSRTFAALIESQDDPASVVDWRMGDVVAMGHRAHDLPNDVAKGCMDLVRRLGLRFGAIDLVLEPSGDYRFLEVNPNGQWGWIQTRTGQPIAGAIVDEMLGLWR